MDYFYVIVLTILIVLLIIILSYYGVVIQQSVNKNRAYPPKPPATCPDFWNIAADGSCNIPKSDSKNIGSIYNNNSLILTNTLGTRGYTAGYSNVGNTGTVNFADPGWSSGGVNATCNQRKWANSFNIMWDGVSNYNGC
jgi:hypothetical protein